MTLWFARSSRSACISLLGLAWLACAAHAQSLVITPETSRALSLAGSVASGDAVGRSPGLAVAAERRLGADWMGRSFALRLQGGTERLRLEGDGNAAGGYVRRRHAAIGFNRYLGAGPRTGVDPYVFAQLNRQWLVERMGTARVDGVGFGAGLDIAPIGSRRAFMVELELGLAEPARLPSGRYVEGVGTSRLQVGYKRRF
jgi:hypothetical protein